MVGITEVSAVLACAAALRWESLACAAAAAAARRRLASLRRRARLITLTARSAASSRQTSSTIATMTSTRIGIGIFRLARNGQKASKAADSGIFKT